MIDINKTRNNFQKFSTLKQKCDPVLKVQQQPILTSNSAKAAETDDVANETTELQPTTPISHPHLKDISATETTAKNTRHNQLQTTTTNAVRVANQQFFLIPAYKDQNFLKEECELAHAQVTVTTSALTTLNELSSTDAPSNAQQHREISEKTKATRGEDTRNNNNNNSSGGLLPRIASNGMRRSGGSSGSDGRNGGLSSSTATKTAHRIDIVFNQFKTPMTPNAATTTNTATTTKTVSKHSTTGGSYAAGAALTTTGSKLSGIGGRHQVKPLVHRSIPSTAVAAANAISYSNKLNNNTSQNTKNNSGGSRSNFNSGSNNNMQHVHNDHDDIKYIDSDEATASVTTEHKAATHCEQRCCLPAPTHAATSSSTVVTTKTRVRPKSTIISSGSSANSQLVFEKVNNYKYANGGGCESTAVLAATNNRRVPPRYSSGIDSSSIKASIEKFNSFSERQRQPLSAVTLRSHSGCSSGSTSNLQHHRHSSSDFDNCNLRLPNSGSSGGGSLTRTTYRSAAAPAVGGGSAASSAAASVKIIASIQHPIVTSVAAVAVSRTAAALGSNSLPTTKSNRSHELAPLSRTVAERSSATSLFHGKHNDATMPLPSKVAVSSLAAAAAEPKKHVSAAPTAMSGLCDAVDESVRTSIRSALPPPSPTASRYWDRDSSGTKTTTTSSYSNNSAADVETNKSSTSSSDAKDEGLCGLRNIGNTCFMNSVIQCLSHTSELTKFLRTHNGLRSSSSKDQQILHEFAKLIREMWTSNVHSVTPLELKRAFSTKHRMYSDYNQQDAQEFLRFFLDSLHSALNTGVKGELLKIDDNQSDNKKADQTWEWYARHENSLIRDLFVGQLKSTLKCTTCGNTSVTFDPFWDLSVSLPSSSRCKLDACLDMFIREEILDGDEMPTCSKCQTRRRCTKSFAIQRFPKYLVIHLKRFSETRWSKLSNIVEFPTGERELNMRTYGSNPNANIYYSLYAISNHMGSTAGGHYVALCKHPVTKKWHEFNDNIVSDALSENHLVSSSAYILFYERV